jgi:hypothetical protein|tara:strand:- start:42 stop:1097 length:1056 start_codon:yes stop_codon:yes gene_type:complete
VATYYDIFGQKIQYISSDPTNVATGQVWYNSTTNVAKLRGVTAAAAWSSTTDRNNAMNNGAGAGTVTDAVFYGGYQPPGNPAPIPAPGGTGYSAITEKWDGTSWTNSGAMNNGGSNVIAYGPSSTSAIAANRYADSPGGVFYTTSTEEFDGSTWTNKNASSTGKESGAGAGVPTAAFATSGNQPHGANNPGTATEEWDGTNWTSGGALNSPGQTGAGAAGTLTAGLICGGQYGYPDTKVAVTQEYNGTAWTSVTAMPATRTRHGQTATPQTAAIFFGGSEGAFSPLLQNLNYDGTNWTTGPSMGRPAPNASAMGGTGTSGGLLASGGSPYVATTEQFLPAGTAETRTVTTS